MVNVFVYPPLISPQGLVLVDMKWARDCKEAVAKVAEQAAAEKIAAAMKKELFLPARKLFLRSLSLWDVSARTQKLRKR